MIETVCIIECDGMQRNKVVRESNGQSNSLVTEGYSATRAFVRNLKYSVLGKVLIFFMLFVYPVTMIGKPYVKISWIR